MSQTILIESINYDGEMATVLFKPDNANVVINLGNVVLPYLFDPSLLNPPREIYGTYTILVLGTDGNCKTDCPNILQVPRPTPTPTPTITPTRTQTPTPTPTTTPTPTFDPCKVPTSTPTTTTTPTITPTHTPTPSATCTNPCGCPEPSRTPRPTRSPRPTPSATSGYCYPTPTPTPTTPLTILSLTAFYSSGSTNINYQLTIGNSLSDDLTLEFTNTLFLTDSDSVDITGQTITILSGETFGESFYVSDVNYDLLNRFVSFDEFNLIIDKVIFYQINTSYYFSGPLPTPTPTITPTKTVTPTNTPTNTSTPTNTPTNTSTPTVTPTNTPTVTSTNTPTVTSTNTPTQTPTVTPTVTETPTSTPTETPTNTPTPTETTTPTPTPTTTTTPVIPNRILYWDFSDLSSYSGTSTVYDLESNSNGTIMNSPTSGSTGCGTYVGFNGTSQYIYTNTNLSTLFSGVSPNKSEITSIFMWIYPQGDGVILSELGDVNSLTGWHSSIIEMVSGTLKFGLWNGTANSVVTSSIPTTFNNWYYVGMTYDGSTLTAYVNGVSAGNITFNRQAPYNVGSNGLFYLLAHQDGTNMGDGGFGDYRVGSFEIYTTALSVGQVNSIYATTSVNYICPTPTPTNTPTPTETPTNTPTPTSTITPTPTNTITPTLTQTPTNTPNLDGFNYSDFSSISGLELVGPYVSQTSNEIYLTSPTVASTGNLYRSTSVRYDRNFSLEWKSYIGGGTGADGYCLQWTRTNNTNGIVGGGIGRIADSSTINAIGFYTLNYNYFQWWKNNSLQSTDSVSVGYWRQVLYFWADYTHSTQTFNLYFNTTNTKPGSPNKQYTSFVFDSTPYYIGFGAATGGSQDYHNIVNWKLTFT
jgi:hypothetical protein